MRNEHDGEVVFGLQYLQEVQDLCLNRDIECRNRFVADQQARFERECSTDRDSLRLPSRQMTRKHVREPIAGETHLAQDFRGGRSAFGCSDFGYHQSLHDEILDRPSRVERTNGVLEDHLHVTA